jgi:hypothetical protein
MCSSGRYTPRRSTVTFTRISLFVGGGGMRGNAGLVQYLEFSGCITEGKEPEDPD